MQVKPGPRDRVILILGSNGECPMFDPIKAWHEEHMYFRRLLGLLQHEMDVFAAGETPNFRLMLDIIGYMRDWADHYHHPREDEAFRRIVKKRPDRGVSVARLQLEHRVVARTGENLERMLTQVAAGAVVPHSEIEIAASTYLVYYGNHITIEEEDLLPLAAEILTEEDWNAVKAVSLPGHHPEYGADPLQRYDELRHRIEMQA